MCRKHILNSEHCCLDEHPLGPSIQRCLAHTWAPLTEDSDASRPKPAHSHAHCCCCWEQEIISSVRSLFLDSEAFLFFFSFFFSQHSPWNCREQSLSGINQTTVLLQTVFPPLRGIETKKEGEEEQHPLICHRVGYSWITMSLGDSQQSADVVKLMYEGEVHAAQKVWSWGLEKSTYSGLQCLSRWVSLQPCDNHWTSHV